jgi:hypothetical protein
MRDIVAARRLARRREAILSGCRKAALGRPFSFRVLGLAERRQGIEGVMAGLVLVKPGHDR